MKTGSLSAIEKAILALVLVILATGFVLFYTDLPTFEWYVREDHLVEWLTVLGLLLGFFVCISRFFKLFKKRNWWFLTVTILLGLLLFFAAGEEISWGQRLLGIKSSEYFKEHNAQGETNLHNLVVNGVKINKLIFSIILSVAMGIYLLVVPIAHAKVEGLKNFLDRSGVPVARLYQIISFVLLFIITTLLKHEKNAELLECGAALLFFLIIRFPKNDYAFDNGINV
jgi:cell division protein FtsW (lipid II flippase)